MSYSFIFKSRFLSEITKKKNQILYHKAAAKIKIKKKQKEKIII